jgi:hypothetical protein
MKLIITVDTEADNQWEIPSGLKLNNLQHIPRFHRLCNNFEFPVTYLVTHEVANSPYARELFLPYLRLKQCEIGAHLHAWSFNKEIDSLTYSHPYAFEYDYNTLHKMIKSLTISIENNLEVKPISYRSGRYGICSNQVKILKRIGYKIESSITPGINWSNAATHPQAELDFRNFPKRVYNIDMNDLQMDGDSGLYEVPISTFDLKTYKNKLKNILGYKYTKVQFRINKHISVKVLKSFVDIALSQNATYIMLFLHSSELMPGGSPYFRNKDDIDNMYNKYTEILNYLRYKRVEGIMLKHTPLY